MSWLFAVFYFTKVVIDLLPADNDCVLGLCWFSQTLILAVLPVLRHLVQVGSLRSPRPTRLWLLGNYGLAAAALLALPLELATQIKVFEFALVTLTTLVLWDIVRLARSGRRPVLMADLRFGGYLALAIFLFASVVILLFTERTDTSQQSIFWVLSHAFVGLTSAAPFALRIFGEVLRSVLLIATRLLIASSIYLGTEHLVTTMDSEFALPLRLAAVLALLLVLGPGSALLSACIDAVVLRHSRKWRDRLHDALRELPADVDTHDACQHAVSRLGEAMRLEGAAILQAAPGLPATVAGNLEIERLTELWPSRLADDGLPTGAFDLLALDDQELQLALYQARVTWVVEIRSAQHHWGHLLVAAGLLGNAAAHDRLQTLVDFTRELALTLDVADLLNRTRTAERDLARHEKLAALGETAARIAHEIRNPVTAARSLAQSIADQPMSPLNNEHALLMVQELDRVEHQVRSMLRFARPDSYDFAVVRIDRLLTQTLDELAITGATEDIEVALKVEPVELSVDAERLRQVLLNLIDNAVDALPKGAPRQLAISLERNAAGALLKIADSGSGIKPELLPRIFEPFVSSKARGTGLGLAIARRIVEAHQGHIQVQARPGGGSEFLVQLCRQSARPRPEQAIWQAAV